MAEVHIASKVTRCPDGFYEIITYSNPIPCGYDRNYAIHKRTPADFDDIDDFCRRMDNVYRARRNVRYLVWANRTKYSKVITLTYAETMLDPKKLQRDIQTFVQAMRRCGYDMKYLYVVEHQVERGVKEGNIGSLHVHMVLFLDKKIDVEDLRKCWKHGRHEVRVIKDIRNLGAYLCKYISKEETVAFNGNFYRCSKGLKRPDQFAFYIEGFCDDLQYQGENHFRLLEKMEITYKRQRRIDYTDALGVVRSQVVTIYQGRMFEDGLSVSAADAVYESEVK